MLYKSGPKFKCIKCLKLLLSEVVAADTRSLTDFISSLHVSFRIPTRLRKVKCHNLKNIPSSRHSPIHARHIIFILYQRYVLLASVDFYLSTFKTTNFVKAMEILRELRHRKIFYVNSKLSLLKVYVFFLDQISISSPFSSSAYFTDTYTDTGYFIDKFCRVCACISKEQFYLNFIASVNSYRFT